MRGLSCGARIAESPARVSASVQAVGLLDASDGRNWPAYGGAYGDMHYSPLAALEQAVRMNAVSVEANLAALHWGRICIAAPKVVEQLLAPASTAPIASAHLPPRIAGRIAAFALGGAVAQRLRPTFLRSLGLRDTVRVGAWFVPVAQALARLKPERGKRCDIFGMIKAGRERLLQQLGGDVSSARASHHIERI
ncbi:MAG: hypothetical protein V4579_10890 [Pseudomonadota bacterium]